MIKILFLEDEPDYREEVADFLRSEKYEVCEVGTIAAALDSLEGIDIGLLDVGLPDGDGTAVAVRLRSKRSNCGIIMLTAQGASASKITSLRDNADYYLVKPVDFDMLLAHIKALERRLVVNWRLHPVTRQLQAPDGYMEALTEQEMTLFQLLAKTPGVVVDRRAIAIAFGIPWLDFDARLLDQTVSRLRRRWRTQSNHELPLRTAHGKGYSFCAAIDVA